MTSTFSLYGVALLLCCSSTHDKDFLRAAAHGDLPRVRTLLARGVDVNATQQNGWTALMLVARDGYDSIARLLIAHGADVRHRSVLYNDVDALMLAVSDGDAPLTGLLVSHGADVNETDDTGSTPLMLATGNGNLSAGRQIRVMRVLLRAGAHINAKDKMGDTALSGLKIELRGLYPRPGLSSVIRFLEQNGAK